MDALQEKVVDAMGEELQEQLQNKILWESPFDVPLLGPIHISESVAMTWFIMAIIMVLVLVLMYVVYHTQKKVEAECAGEV